MMKPLPGIDFMEKRYILREQIGEGGMGTVFRATDRLVGQDVALKRVTARQEQLSFQSQSQSINLTVALANEFQTLASFRHPNIVSVLDYGFDTSQQPFFTMDLLDNPQTIIEKAKDLTLSNRFELLMQLMQALNYLHRRGVLHRDLKPGNVLVVDDKVKVLDFGLAISHDYSVNKENLESEEIVGTLDYIAPEVLNGQSATEAADLYAAGVMAYEMVALEHPFTRNNITQLMVDILTTEPDIAALDVEENIQVMIGRLLSKDPAMRFKSAGAVLDYYTETTGIKLSQESHAIRESFLQSARFIGRDVEFAKLQDSLQIAMNGELQAWLIGGESGVGKSRLMDELRSSALVNGVLVARGIAASEGASLYQVWRDILRLLALNSDLSEEEAGILKIIIPEIDSLLSFENIDTAEIDPKQVQPILLRTIAAFIERIERPLLIILEDLQWAGSESIALLTHIIQNLSSEKILIVGNYRDDEKADLPEQLPLMQSMKLQRLQSDSIARLSAEMLGEVGRNPQVVDVLQRESEGNVFFLVEIVRTLAEEAGNLRQIGQITLPNDLYSGGIKRVIENRISRIPQEDRELLQLMAIAGRQVDTNLISVLSPATNIEEWLSNCSNIAVLSIQNENWYFSHDKLREGILGDLETGQSSTMHRQVAEAIEQVYPGDAAHNAILAYHWLQAGETEKALQYSQAAGEQSMKLGANAEAKKFFEQALDALEQLPVNDDNRRRMIELTLNLARVSAFIPTDNVSVALKDALEAAETLKDEALRTRVIASTGAFNYMTGNFGEALRFFNMSIELAESLGLEELLILPYNILGRNMMVAGDWDDAEETLKKGIRILKSEHGDQELLAGSQAFYAAVCTVKGNLEEAQIHVDECLQLADKLGLPSRIAGNKMVLGFANVMTGNFDLALGYLQDSLELASKNNDFHPLYMSHGCMGYAYLLREEYDKAAEHLDSAIKITEQAPFVPYVPMFRAGRALITMRDGDRDKALEQIEQAIELAQKASQKTSEAENYRILSQLYLAQDESDVDKAEEMLLKAYQIHHDGGATTLIAKTALDLAFFYEMRGDNARAAKYLSEANGLLEQTAMD